MKLYNSLSKKIEEFIPQQKNNVSMYVCGITPYDTTHLGHAFTYVFFDVLYRYLTYKGYDVNYTQNVTDIDDDILKRAKRDKRDWKELGNFWTGKFLTDLKNLNVLSPTHYVKATDSIPTIIEITQKLIKNNVAYEKNGNVFFDVKKFSDYGKLSRFTNDQMLQIAKERGGTPDDASKKNPLDFILWKNSLPGEPSWESPFGSGRPGWHIECSAMNYEYLGEQIDIHGGGRDLIFPHHESEIAQTESFIEKKPFSKYWMHIAMLMYQGEKMSKSLGNLVMVSDLLKKYSAGAIRWVLLSHHYRQPWEFYEDELQEAEKKLGNLYKKTNSAKIEENAADTFELYMDNDMHVGQVLNSLENIGNKKTVEQYLTILGFPRSV